MGISIVMGVAQQLDGSKMGTLLNMDDKWGYPYDLGNLHMSIQRGRFHGIWVGFFRWFIGIESTIPWED